MDINEEISDIGIVPRAQNEQQAEDATSSDTEGKDK